LFVENKALVIANTTLQTLLQDSGMLVYKQIISYPSLGTYTPGTDITNEAISSSSESLTVNTFKAGKVTVDDTEKKQSLVELAQNVTRKFMKQGNNIIEQAVMAEVTNSSWSLDDGNIGGTPGSNMSLNTSNIPQVFISADTKLNAIDAPKAGRTALVGGHFVGLLKLQQAGRNTVFGDGVNTRGVITNLFGWDILETNNLPYSAKITIATNPTHNDTITIQGVVFTFADTLNGAGYLHICSDAANTVANMVVAWNALATAITENTNTGYTPISSDDLFLLRDKRGLTAAATSATITTISGFGDIVVSENLSAPADVWSAWRQDSLFCVRGCIDLIVQIPPRIEVGRDPDQFSDIVKTMFGYGKKTYADGAREMVRVKIAAGATSGSDWV
jgi:hypothetical protein